MICRLLIDTTMHFLLHKLPSKVDCGSARENYIETIVSQRNLLRGLYFDL